MVLQTTCFRNGPHTGRSAPARVKLQQLVESGAELDDAGAGGFYRMREAGCGRIVEEKDDAIKIAFAGASGESEAERVKEFAAANVQ